MKEIYKDAFAEVDKILEYADEESLNQIPEKLRKFIKENKSNYNAKIAPNKKLIEQNLLYETKVILSVLYRDYWETEEKRKELFEKDKKELVELEIKKAEKYNVENLFKNRNNNEDKNKK